MRTIVSTLVLSSASLVVLAQDCSWSENGVTFDLSMLSRDAANSYSVVDIRNGTNDPNHDFSYVFNVCGNTDVPPRASEETCTTEAPAFQMQPRPNTQNYDNC